MPAGLPDFRDLTLGIIDRLGADKVKAAIENGDGFDRLFNLLIREFGREEIDRQIFNDLKTPRRPKLDNHRIILDLSRGSAGNTQIVTTNFDLLFERVNSNVRRIVPPALPDLTLNQPIDGIVYLHGRLTKPEPSTTAGYVIASADFGRAYLAEGWAARFIKALRERYTIVLLGYRAEDPPMRYLLEGLNIQDGINYESPIYAFSSARPDVAEEEWMDRGVTPICYSSNNGHATLWETLAAWAEMARDPETWNLKVVGLAQKRPSDLRSYERGQVVELISTKAGAQLFANAKPTPPSEWLCVFDPSVRNAKPRKAIWNFEAGEIDPQVVYGLDDDLPHPISEASDFAPISGRNPLVWRRGDTSFSERIGLQEWDSRWSNPLPERLHLIARWFGSVMHEPAAIWWVVGWKRLNPSMLLLINDQLRDVKFPEMARKFWNLYAESQNVFPFDDRDHRWFVFKEHLSKNGWASSTIRLFEKSNAPFIEFRRPFLGAPHPPEGDWEDLELWNVVESKVTVLDRHGGSLEIPNEILAEIVSIIRRCLVQTSLLLDEINTTWLLMPTLHPTEGRGATFHGRKAKQFLWLKDLFLKLLEHDLSAARAEFYRWPHNDRYFFSKLTIYVVMHDTLVTAEEAFNILMSLSSEIFWGSDSQRELLWTLRERWADLSSRQQRAIERRIIAGPYRGKNEKHRDYRLRRSSEAASRLRWLEINACVLSPKASQKLQALKAIDERWNEEWARSADFAHESRSGAVARITDPMDLERVPVGNIIEIALSKTKNDQFEFQDIRPFEGLVQKAPFKALSALRYAYKRGSFPQKFWQNLLSEWPEEASIRLRLLLGNSIACLASEHALSLRHYAPRWLRQNLHSLSGKNEANALRMFDGFLIPYQTAAKGLTKSSMGTTSIGGRVQIRSEVSISKAINSPIGNLAEALWSLLPRKATNQHPLPRNLESRFRLLFNMEGDGGGHAVAVIAKNLGWLDYCYREWTHRTLVPMFSLKHPRAEAAWHGLAHDRNGLSKETLVAMNESFLALLRGESQWSLDPDELRTHIHRLIFLSRDNDGSGSAISFAQVRQVLLRLNDSGRASALRALLKIVEEEGTWDGFVKPFIERAWPRQLRFRNDEASRGFADIAEAAGEAFPDAVVTVLPFIRPVSQLDMLTYKIVEEEPENRNFARRFPKATLSLLNALIADGRSQMPYELGKALEVIAEVDPGLRQSASWRRLKKLVGG